MKTIKFNAPCHIGDTVYTVESIFDTDSEFSLWDWEV